ncbi:hypothetical protein HS041_12040 [Planomonospora sp. ID67723]|uniref:hypothetical protein n=1 Tax=Planomonospora sp. ID67723 TaxID=2738134 RepID=UPI0018C3AD86|nr:hypothetical protein [Planomonospora sp. ID67723]MBG0828498.1 hypothetical protein [Planomonospora sp. ID67723]
MSARDIAEAGRSQTLTTPRGVWSIAAKHTRPGGDVDVVLVFRPTGNVAGTHFGYRYDRASDRWTQVLGAWLARHDAVREVAKRTRVQVLVYRDLVPLLCIAATVTDFPDSVAVRAEAS